MTRDDASLSCSHCQTRYRVKEPRALRAGTRSRCRSCGAAFAVVAATRQASMPLGRPASPSKSRLRFSFHADGKTLLGMQSVNVFLTLMTLGLYHFWGKVKVRRYLFSQASWAGDRFAYHGTGRELLIGFIRALVMFGIPYAVLTSGPELASLPTWPTFIAGWIGALLMMLYVPVAVVGVRRYRMSRSSWRGVRFSFRGQAWPFVLLSLSGLALTAVTLGAYYPYYLAKRHRYLISHTYFGNARFQFDGNGSMLVPTWTKLCGVTAAAASAIVMITTNQPLLYTWLSPTLIVWATQDIPRWIWLALGVAFFVGLTQWVIYFLAAKQRFLWNHTTVDGKRFQSTVSYGNLVRLYAGNLLLLLGTAGFAWPWVTIRTTSFYLTHLSLQGPPEFSHVQQDQHEGSTTGEGLTNFLDTGFELD